MGISSAASCFPHKLQPRLQSADSPLVDPVEQPKVVLPGQLPLGDARLVRPADVRRLRFDNFLRIPNAARPRVVRVGESWPVIPIEAVAAGDTQVLAAHEPGKIDSPHLDLDPLADFPSVE